MLKYPTKTYAVSVNWNLKILYIVEWESTYIIKKIKHENCEDFSSLHHRWVVFACLSVNCLRLWQHTDRHEHLHQETHGQRFFFFFSFPIRYRFLSHLIIIIQIASRLGCVRFRSIEFSCFGLIIKSACYYFVQRLFVRVNVKWQTPVEVVYCFNQPHKPLDRLILPMNFVWWLE